MNTFGLESEMTRARYEYRKQRDRYQIALKNKDWRSAKALHPAYMEARERYEAAAQALEAALHPKVPLA